MVAWRIRCAYINVSVEVEMQRETSRSALRWHHLFAVAAVLLSVDPASAQYFCNGEPYSTIVVINGDNLNIDSDFFPQPFNCSRENNSLFDCKSTDGAITFIHVVDGGDWLAVLAAGSETIAVLDYCSE